MIGAAVGGVRVELVTLPSHPDGTPDLVTAFTRLGSPCLLESGSADAPHAHDGWSYLVVHAAGRLVHDGRRARLLTPAAHRDLGPDPFAALDEVCALLGSTPWSAPDTNAPVPPFTHGLVGVFSYDLGRAIEQVGESAVDDRRQAWLDLVIATGVIAVHRATSRAWYARADVPLDGLVPPPDGDDVQRRLAATDLPTTTHPGGPDESIAAPPSSHRRVTSTMTRAAHASAVAAALDHIAAGDVFQVNLAHRLSTTWTTGDVALYRALRAASPAPHLALYRCSDGSSLLSISPETYLHAKAGHVQTRPIKGTRPRDVDPAADARSRDELTASAKDRAENVMVVDMERNDLGRVCVPGSVEVPGLLEVEAHPTVWQLVSTVEGQLAPGTSWASLLRATFPCGSVTGTPKVRAMQLIEQLEPVRRGWYCGAIGLLGAGHAALSVAIRTAVLDGGCVDYAAGGGIVADSDIDAEYEETLAKAAAFLGAVGADEVAP